MREIKFRALKVSGEIIVGSLDNKLKRFPLIWPTYETGYSVRPETIGQYTGIKDKNGVEIYEGDIVRFRNGATTRESYFVGDVVFEKGEFGQRAVKYEGAYPPFMFTAKDILPLKNSKLIEVIGNIYENAELLNETEG